MSDVPKVTQLDHVSCLPIWPFPISERQDCNSRAVYPGLEAGGRREGRQRHRWVPGCGSGVGCLAEAWAPRRRGSAEVCVGATWRRGPAPAPAQPPSSPPARASLPCAQPPRLQRRSRAQSPSGDPGSARVLPGAPSRLTGLPRIERTRPREAGCAGQNPVGCGGSHIYPAWKPLHGAAGTRASVSAAQETEAQMVSDRTGLGPKTA